MKYSKIALIIVFMLIFVVSGVTHAQDADETFTVGFWSVGLVDEFKAEMAELGYIEGENITYMSSETGLDDMTTAQALVDANVDVIVTITDSSAKSLQELTTDIPIVFFLSDDPVTIGAVEDLVNPGGNATGSITSKPSEGRLQVLTEIDPSTRKVIYLYNPQNAGTEGLMRSVGELAEELDVELEPVAISDLETGLKVLQENPFEDADWFFMTPLLPRDAEFFQALVAVSLSHQAGIADVIGIPQPGVLLGYGPNINEAGRQTARMVDQILRGADPANLAIQTVENFLTVNLEAAEAIGLTIPRSVLRKADTIVRPGDFDEE